MNIIKLNNGILKFSYVFISVFVVSSVIPCTLTAQVFQFQWGITGAGNGQFSNPSWIAIDSVNNVYVVDSGNNRIQKFDPQGLFLLSWGANGSDNGQFDSPQGISIDSNDAIYVVDSGNNRIQKFDNIGAFTASWGTAEIGDSQFDSPHGIAVDSLGNIYVTDLGNDRIQKFDSEGNYIYSWGPTGSYYYQFDSPNAIAIDSTDRMLVADSNDLITVFAANGSLLDTHGRPGSKGGEFSDIMGIAVDAENNIYVSEFGSIRVQKRNSSGGYHTKWGIFGKNEGEFDWPLGIAINKLGYIYVVDSRNNRIQVFATPLPPTFYENAYYFEYTWSNQRITEENGLICEPEANFSGYGKIYQTDRGYIETCLNHICYGGFVSGETYTGSKTINDTNSIVTENIIITLESLTSGFGNSHLAKTDNMGSYCRVEGDIYLEIYSTSKNEESGVENINYKIPGFWESGSGGCFISSSVL